MGEGAAKIEVTECGHMPGDFRFVGVRADFTENTFQRRADDGELHPRDRIARVTQDGGNGFENVRRAIHKRAVKVKENGRERERGKAASKTPCNVHRKSRKPRHMRAYTGKRVPSYGCALPQVNLCGASAVSVVARPRPLGQARGTC